LLARHPVYILKCSNPSGILPSGGTFVPLQAAPWWRASYAETTAKMKQIKCEMLLCK
jgi:hypothetical protein